MNNVDLPRLRKHLPAMAGLELQAARRAAADSFNIVTMCPTSSASLTTEPLSAHCFIFALPNEMLDRIFSHLPLFDTVSVGPPNVLVTQLVLLTRVCKRFRTVVYHSPVFLQDDFCFENLFPGRRDFQAHSRSHLAIRDQLSDRSPIQTLLEKKTLWNFRCHCVFEDVLAKIPQFENAQAVRFPAFSGLVPHVALQRLSVRCQDIARLDVSFDAYCKLPLDFVSRHFPSLSHFSFRLIFLQAEQRNDCLDGFTGLKTLAIRSARAMHRECYLPSQSLHTVTRLLVDCNSCSLPLYKFTRLTDVEVCTNSWDLASTLASPTETPIQSLRADLPFTRRTDFDTLKNPFQLPALAQLRKLSWSIITCMFFRVRTVYQCCAALFCWTANLPSLEELAVRSPVDTVGVWNLSKSKSLKKFQWLVYDGGLHEGPEHQRFLADPQGYVVDVFRDCDVRTKVRVVDDGWALFDAARCTVHDELHWGR